MPPLPPRRCLILFPLSHRTAQQVLALAGVGEAVAVPAQEIAPRRIQFGDAPAARCPIHDAGADEIRSRPTVAARHADDADALGYVLPLAAADTHAVAEMQPVGLRVQLDRGDLLAIARSFQRAAAAADNALLPYVERFLGVPNKSKDKRSFWK